MKKKVFLTTLFLKVIATIKIGFLSAQILDPSPNDTVPVPTFSIAGNFPTVIVYASKTKNLFAVSTIEKKDIEQLTDPSIEPLLNSTPGLWMQSGALNTNRISIRGVGYREPFATTGIKVYLDEIPLTNGVGEANIEDINPFILAGIDIWRGPSSALWGSGLGGMIHLKTEIPYVDKINTRIQTGSYDRFQFDQNISLRYGIGDKWGTSLHYQYLSDDGFRVNNEYKKHSWTWMQQWSNHKGLSLKSFLHGIDLKAFIPSSLNLSDYENNPSIAAPTWAAMRGNEDYTKWITGTNLQYTTQKGWVYHGAIYATTFQSDEVRPFNVLDEGSTSLGTRHRLTFHIRNFAFITTGLEVFREKYQFSTFETLSGGVPGNKLTGEEEFRSYFNGFVQSEFKLGDKWNLVTGLHGNISGLHSGELRTSFPLSVYPTCGVHYLLNDLLSFSGSVSRGYSSLSLDDVLNSSGLVNHNIVPETGWSKEVSIRVGKLSSSFVKLILFHMSIENTVITKRLADDLFEKINGGSSVHRGIELEYEISENLKKLHWKGAYTYGSNLFNDFIDNGNDYNGNVLPGSPAHRSYNRVLWNTLTSWSFMIDHHLVSNVFLSDNNTIKSEGYQLINLGIDYKFKTGLRKNWIWSISGKIHNLFDTKYSAMFQINALGAQPRYYYPGKPRSFYFSVNLEYNI